jgi:hypothetical protein
MTHLDTHLRGLLDVAQDRIEPPVARRSRGQHDVLRIHPDGFEDDAGRVAVVTHPFQLVEVP